MKPIVVCVLLELTVSTALAAERTVTFSVPDMTCALCPLTVETAMSRVDGVIRVDANFESRTARVTYDDTVAVPEQIAEASTNAGYPASLAARQ